MLPNAAHFTFFTTLDAQIEASPAVRAALTVQMTIFDPLLESERQNMDWVKKSEYTSLIKVADKRVDAALSGLKAQTVAARHSLQPEIVAAANRMLILLNNYGDVAKKPYQEETGDVQALLDNLTGSYSADARITGNDVWVTELQTALTEFNTLYATRNEQVILKPAKNFRTTRREIEVVYHQMTSIIESNALLGMSPDFENFIIRLNPEIEKLNTEFHHAKINISDCEPAPIAQQAFTGQPVTPLPDVYRVTSKGTVKLELGKDFNLSYRNNVNVGNADCIITGKGAYKGSRTVTFIIAHAI
jgi:hypothetical protein